jgi:hypothetical protein
MRYKRLGDTNLMPLELWILLGLGAAVAMVGAVRRLGGSARRERDKETKNVYPLW